MGGNRGEKKKINKRNPTGKGVAEGEGWAAPAEGKGLDAERGTETNARKRQAIQFGSRGFGFSVSQEQPAREGGRMLCPAPLLRRPQTLQEAARALFPPKNCPFFSQDSSWERQDVLKPPVAPKGPHHLPPAAFSGRRSQQGLMGLGISLFGARINLYWNSTAGSEMIFKLVLGERRWRETAIPGAVWQRGRGAPRAAHQRAMRLIRSRHWRLARARTAVFFGRERSGWRLNNH